jgi:polysaccharide biosynthesis/export protein
MSLSSCYNYKTLRLLQEDDPKLPVYEKSTYKDYKIRVNDEIVFRLITSDETVSKLISPNSGGSGTQNQISYRVYSDSTFDLPFVSHIKVAGLTMQEATIVVQDRLKELIPDAEVRLNLANKTFWVFGDAGNGSYPIYKDRLTIYQALSMSSDLPEQIDRSNITILRETDKGRETISFDIRPKSLIDSKYYYIYPNDIIYVKRTSSSFYKVNSYPALLSIINFSMQMIISVGIYSSQVGK